MERIRTEYFDEETKYIGKNKACETCAHCGQNLLSDDPDIAEEMLCDRCANEINGMEVIGYRKGE